MSRLNILLVQIAALIYLNQIASTENENVSYHPLLFHDDKIEARTFGFLFPQKTDAAHKIIKSQNGANNPYKWIKKLRKQQKRKSYHRRRQIRKCQPHKFRILRKSDNEAMFGVRDHLPYGSGREYFPQRPSQISYPVMFKENYYPGPPSHVYPMIPMRRNPMVMKMRRPPNFITHPMIPRKPWMQPLPRQVPRPGLIHQKQHPVVPIINYTKQYRNPITPVENHVISEEESNIVTNYVRVNTIYKENNTEDAWKPSFPPPNVFSYSYINKKVNEIPNARKPTQEVTLKPKSEQNVVTVTPSSSWSISNTTKSGESTPKKLHSKYMSKAKGNLQFVANEDHGKTDKLMLLPRKRSQEPEIYAVNMDADALHDNGQQKHHSVAHARNNNYWQ